MNFRERMHWRLWKLTHLGRKPPPAGQSRTDCALRRRRAGIFARSRSSSVRGLVRMIPTCPIMTKRANQKPGRYRMPRTGRLIAIDSHSVQNVRELQPNRISLVYA